MVDYGYIEYYRRALANTTNAEKGIRYSYKILNGEALKDYHSISLRQINHLVQIDETPNLKLKEPRWELYKISLSLQCDGKLTFRL